MVEYTLEHMIFSVFLVGFLIFTATFATQYAGAQAQATLKVELRNVVLLVGQELLDAYRTVNATRASSFILPVTIPRAIQGRAYSVYLFANGTLRGVVERTIFETRLPSISNCIWDESVFRSGGSAVPITAEYVTATNLVRVSLGS
jgi:hypothetical protein